VRKKSSTIAECVFQWVSPLVLPLLPHPLQIHHHHGDFEKNQNIWNGSLQLRNFWAYHPALGRAIGLEILHCENLAIAWANKILTFHHLVLDPHIFALFLQPLDCASQLPQLLPKASIQVTY
jgi:hypothetical protein